MDLVIQSVSGETYSYGRDTLALAANDHLIIHAGSGEPILNVQVPQDKSWRVVLTVQVFEKNT